jgi:hypothetical protein
MKLPDLTLLRELKSDQVYPTGFVARVFGVTQVTVQWWCRSGKLASVRRPVSGHLLIPGTAILALAGGLLMVAASAASETRSDRRKRADEAAEACRRLARKRRAE